MNSVTKGVMALLAGIAVDKGFIKSVDEKVIDFFPDYQVKKGEKTIYDVTLKHLLTMTAPYKGKSEPWKKVCTSDDWTKAALDFLGGRNGITGEFRYATLGIQILAGNFVMLRLEFRYLPESSSDPQERSVSTSQTGICSSRLGFLNTHCMGTAARKTSSTFL